MSRTLEGKRALVTGGASGIGRAIAAAFAAEGAQVAIADIAKSVEAVADEVAAAGGRVFAVRADVADEDQVLKLFTIALPRLGGLDILVNNAGIMLDKPLFETTAADFDRVVGVNLRGVFLVGREGLRAMAGRLGGRVINMTSELAYLGRERYSVYCATKGGVLSMTRSWAREFAPDILINAIAPGPIDTPMLGPQFTTPESLKKETTLLGRIGRPEEVASVALFLAGPGAAFMTGQCVSPNGGVVML